jgi:hypothetical protein
MPNDEDFQYLPTQAVAEYLSEKIEPRLDGLIFPSSQRDGAGENVVLFRRATTVEPDNTDHMEFDTHFGRVSEDDEDLDITVWMKAKKPPENPDSANRSWDGSAEPPERADEPALRVDFDAIEVRDIRAVEYTMARNAGASESHRFLAKVPAPRRRVPSVPAFRKMRVQAAARAFTDIGGSRRAEGKPSRSRPAGASMR